MSQPQKTWYEVKCLVPEDLEDAACGVLMEMGAMGTWSEDAKEPAFKNVHGYFDIAHANEDLLPTLSGLLTQIPSITTRIPITGKLLEESDWLAEWKKHHKPEKIGKSLHILPSWWDPSNVGGTVIRIDPGMAFGTGGHPTTRLCLTVLEETVQGWPKSERLSMMDLGCGSGILAIAGMKLGMGEAVGVDNDSVALENARENAQLNAVEVEFLNETPVGRKFHLLISNIYAETHLQLKDSMMASMEDEGRIILSGIMSSKKEMVINAFNGPDLELVEEREEEGWACLVFQKS